jgi:hypothetical protein
MIVIGAGGCVVRDKVQGMVNSTDRDDFVSSWEQFYQGAKHVCRDNETTPPQVST